ncbi:MAG TPA: RNA polymerase subunit sigma-70 [Porphyromonadaceae bacterium]|jgi:RNA polymerase sigma factor (sigma-70 family)|uniref:RNA polymerase sigma factor n=1 Tax=Limibacterium fermenti TaxID=3229863 RepID=UPI000E82AA4A|nr:RNA polymerase subunit sigma-70 [Porphyromonadaceae bacterium]HBK32704.1 RNA polymerase subunit sigma-70 [Porphyromonadaceae bacterium]HBL33805.1 RNA polymerase subunit sigma-70 [Porphyromonadaceae bacterium]HBX20026.1 RNA polymerase subunit sigma-70 [Porphyromonadaceae bacterium]HBX44996.1 RNA polymerase subunit sigma-70 [Porphyromonadaceae bacterium]
MINSKDIESIYNLYVEDLFTYAIYLGLDRDQAMDAIHDIFCKLADEKNPTDTIKNMKFYLFASLKNRIYDLYRTRRQYIDIHTVEESQEEPFDIHVNMEDILIEKEEQALVKHQIEEMLHSLTSRQREIIYLRYVQEYEYTEIAELLNISIHGCRKLVSKAIQSLREKYGSLTLLFFLSIM